MLMSAFFAMTSTFFTISMVSAQCSVIPVLVLGKGRSFECLRDADGLASLTARGTDGEFGCISPSLQPLWTDSP